MTYKENHEEEKWWYECDWCKKLSDPFPFLQSGNDDVKKWKFFDVGFDVHLCPQCQSNINIEKKIVEDKPGLLIPINNADMIRAGIFSPVATNRQYAHISITFPPTSEAPYHKISLTMSNEVFMDLVDMLIRIKTENT